MPSTSNPTHVPVAIVGLACRFPGEATSPSKFWDLLKNGKGEWLASEVAQVDMVDRLGTSSVGELY